MPIITQTFQWHGTPASGRDGIPVRQWEPSVYFAAHSHLTGVSWLQLCSVESLYQSQVKRARVKCKLFSVVRSQSMWVTNTVALFPWVSLVFHMWEEFQTWEVCIQTSYIFLFLIETTRLTIKNNTSLASKLRKALGQNLTSTGIGQAPTATTLFGCQAGPQAPQEQLSVGLWSVETEQMCLPANALWDGVALWAYWNQMPSPQSCPANTWWLHASAITLENYKSHDSTSSPPCKTPFSPTGQEKGLPSSITHFEGPGPCQTKVLLDS